MNLAAYCENILMPTLDMLLDMCECGDIRFEDAQRIGYSICSIDSLELIYDSFDIELEKIKRKG